MSNSEGPINPKHYNIYGDSVINLIKHLPFVEGSIIKYVARYNNKNGLEDLEKAKWYLEYLIQMNTKGDKDERD